MKFKAISFDLQGTLSDLAFSDEFWLELLPALYAEKKNVSVSEAKIFLKDCFKQVGRYDCKYYSINHWLDEYGLEKDWQTLLRRVKTPARLFQDTKLIVNQLQEKCPLLLFSATTLPFIHHELGELKSSFTWIISALDDLQTAGKPPEAYHYLSKMIGAAPNEILHIGDDFQMDVENARKAGWNAFYLDPKISRDENIHHLWKMIT